MTKQQFIDEAFLMLYPLKSKHDSPEDVWARAQELWKSRPKNKPQAKRDVFVKPSPSEVQQYIDEQKYFGFDGELFVNHYTANGWKIGRNPMKDWKSAVRNWWRTYKEKHPERFPDNKPAARVRI